MSEIVRFMEGVIAVIVTNWKRFVLIEWSEFFASVCTYVSVMRNKLWELFQKPFGRNNSNIQRLFKGTFRFTDEHVELILNKSKMCNWPEKFKSKKLLRENKEKFKELIGIRL